MNLSNQNIKTLFSVLLISSMLGLLPSCSKSRRDDRAGTPKSPQRVRGANQQTVPRDIPRQSKHHEIPELPEPDVASPGERRTVKKTQLKTVPTPRKTKRSTEGMRNVEVHGENKEVVNSNARKTTTELGCRAKDCIKNKTKPQQTKRPAPQVTPVKKPETNDSPVIVRPVQTPQATPVKADPVFAITNEFKSFQHFHILLVVDPRSIKINLENGQRKQRVFGIVKDFVDGLVQKQVELQGVDPHEVHFTLGLLAGTTEPKHSGVFFNDYVKDYDLNQMDLLEKDLTQHLKILASEQFQGTNHERIPGGYTFQSLQKFIDSNPGSANPNQQFLSKNVPTVVMAISDKKDLCNLDAYIRSDDGSSATQKDCNELHNYSAQLNELIYKKIDFQGSGHVASVTTKQILMKENGKLITFNKYDNQNHIPYDPFYHGKIFSYRMQQRKRFHQLDRSKIKNPQNVSLNNLNKTPGSTCYISEDSLIMYTDMNLASYLYKESENEKGNCQVVSDEALAGQVALQVQKIDMESMNATPSTHPQLTQ